MRNLFRLVPVVFILAALAAIAWYIEIPYNINTRGVVVPIREWGLERLANGTMLNTEKNNLTNRVSYYSMLEFQRGDHAEFISNDKVFSENAVNKGDTIGHIRSFEEERRLLDLQSGLEEQRRLLQVHLSGEKREELTAARERLILAEQEYDIQKKQTERMESLHESGVVSDESWELALNAYQVKKQNMNIARADMEVVASGSKQEEIELVRATINSFQRQIEQTGSRIDAFTILAPFSGTIIRDRAPGTDNEAIIRVADMEKLIVNLPVEYYQLGYIDNGNHVNLSINSGRQIYSARVIEVDNTVQFIDQRQNIFITAIIEEDIEMLIPNMVLQAEIECGEITAWDYIKRMFKMIFEH